MLAQPLRALFGKRQGLTPMSRGILMLEEEVSDCSRVSLLLHEVLPGN